MLHDVVVQRWGAEIVSGAMPPGYRMGIDAVAARFGVSRTVVREAVRVLESMGLLTVRQRIGTTVLSADRWNSFDANVFRWRITGPDAAQHLHEFGEIRAVNEPLGAALAAQRATKEQIGALTATVVRMAATARSGDLATLATLDVTFHRTVLDASANPFLMGLAGLIGEAIIGQAVPRTSTGCLPAGTALHLAVAIAIQSGDSHGAEVATRAMLNGNHQTQHPVSDAADGE